MAFTLNDLPEDTARLIRTAADVARTTDTKLYLVGGVIRDILRGKAGAVVDADLAAQDNTDDFAFALAHKLNGVLHGPTPFLTYRIDYTANGTKRCLDIVTPRSETYSAPGALPVVEPSDILNDLKRRDFTVNAMAMRIDNSDSTIIDPFDGQNDLAARRLRVMHGKSFIDDPTRMFRAARFAARCDMELDSPEKQLICDALQHLAALSGTRVRHELELISREKTASESVMLLDQWGILERMAFSPTSATRCRTLFDTIDRHPDLFGDNQIRLHLLIAGLCDGFLPQRIARVCGFFAFNSASTETVIACCNPQSVAERLKQATATADSQRAADSAADDILRPLQKEMLAALIANAPLADASLTETAVIRHLTLWRNLPPLLSGNDITGLGVPPGPAVGTLLSTIRRNRIAGTITTRNEAIDFIRGRRNL